MESGNTNFQKRKEGKKGACLRPVSAVSVHRRPTHLGSIQCTPLPLFSTFKLQILSLLTECVCVYCFSFFFSYTTNSQSLCTRIPHSLPVRITSSMEVSQGFMSKISHHLTRSETKRPLNSCVSSAMLFLFFVLFPFECHVFSYLFYFN